MIDELDRVLEHLKADPPPSQAVLERLRRELEARTFVAADDRAERAVRTPLHLSRRSRIGVALLGAVAAALATILLLPSDSGGPQPAAASELHHLAAVAAAQPATNPPALGQYQYTDSEDAYENCTSTLTPASTTTSVPAGNPGSVPAGNSGSVPGTTTPGTTVSPTGRNDYCVLVPEHRQIWIGADFSGRLLETFGAPEFLSPVDKAAWEASGSPLDADHNSDVTFGPHTLGDGPPNFSTLPVDPSALAKMISNRQIESGPPGPAEDFNQIGDLMRETDASPALRAALYQVAATIPGVELLGQVADHAGTVGIGVAYIDNGVRNELIFDPSTSALLGEESVAVVDQPGGYDVPAGTVLNWADYLSFGIVDSLSTTPTGMVSPAPPVTCTAIDPATLPAGSMKPVAGDQEAWPTRCTGNGP